LLKAEEWGRKGGGERVTVPIEYGVKCTPDFSGVEKRKGEKEEENVEGETSCGAYACGGGEGCGVEERDVEREGKKVLG
jgi:hypothetical protein